MVTARARECRPALGAAPSTQMARLTVARQGQNPLSQRIPLLEQPVVGRIAVQEVGDGEAFFQPGKRDELGQAFFRGLAFDPRDEPERLER